MTHNTPAVSEPVTASTPGPGRTILLVALPILLLAVVIAVFVRTDGAGLSAKPAAPIEALQFERATLKPGMIELHLRNVSPQTVAIAQVIINDSYWAFAATPGPAIPRLANATIRLDYPWVEGEAYAIRLISSSAIGFDASIAVAAETRAADVSTLLSFTLIGLYVGVIPIVLGMLWLPVLRRMSRRWMVFFTAVTIGLLIFLGIDATSEALELANGLGGAFQGIGIVGIGIVATFMLLQAISQRQASPRGGSATAPDPARTRVSLAFMIAIGIGLHNFGEGLAIGASFAVGAASLGTFLVVGFIIQNITEGLAIVTPIAGDPPRLSDLGLMGLIGGGPAIAGAWIGGLSYSQPLAILFLSVGAGAVFVVVYQLFRMLQKNYANAPSPLTQFAGVTAGMLILWLTGLLIK